VKKRAQFPFPSPLPAPVTLDQKLYWAVFNACLAASWAEARAIDALNSAQSAVFWNERFRFLEVAYEHSMLRAQARESGIADNVLKGSAGVVPGDWKS